MALRILFVTSSDRVYLPRFFAEFFRLTEGKHAVGVAATPLSRGLRFVWRRLRTFPAYFAPLMLLQAWRMLFPAGGAGLERVCRRHGAEHHSLARVDDAALAALIARFAPDYLISVGCPHILPRDVVENRCYAAWNFHGGRIPSYRGAMTPLWALAEGEVPVLTWHAMVAQVDAGSVVAERALPIAPGESFHHYSLRMLSAAAALLAETLAKPPSLRSPPEMAQSRYCDWPTSRQGHALRKRGVPLWIGKRS